MRREHQLQGATNVTVRNIITSMRLISDVDWAKLFEAVSPVDDVLRAGSDFAAMDFATRNLYRTAIEQIARGTELAEAGDRARALSQAAAASPDMRRRSAAARSWLSSDRRRPARLRAVGAVPPARPRLAAALRAPRASRAMSRSVSFTAAVVLFLPLLALAQVGLTGWQLARRWS